jgi:hypothetical protein
MLQQLNYVLDYDYRCYEVYKFHTIGLFIAYARRQFTFGGWKKLWFCGKAWKSILHQPQYTTAHSEGLNQIIIIFRGRNRWKLHRRFTCRPVMSMVLLQATNNVERWFQNDDIIKQENTKPRDEINVSAHALGDYVRLWPFSVDTESILPYPARQVDMAEARLMNWRHLLSGYSTLFTKRTKSWF